MKMQEKWAQDILLRRYPKGAEYYYRPKVDELKYQKTTKNSNPADKNSSPELLTVKLRYK